MVGGLSYSRSPLSHLLLCSSAGRCGESGWGKRVQLMIDLDGEVKLVLARGESCQV